MVGISGGHARATIVPMYRVDDIAAAVSAVRSAGGTATDPEVQPYGITSTCTDLAKRIGDAGAIAGEAAGRGKLAHVADDRHPILIR